MKLNKIILTVAVSLAALTSAPAFSRDVAVSVSVGHPGFFGTVNVGGHRVERVVYEPYVTYAPRVVRYEPAYYAPRYDRHHHHDRYCGPRHYSRYGHDGHRRGGHREWSERGDDHRDYRGGRGRHD